jgi:hypothetical protein
MGRAELLRESYKNYKKEKPEKKPKAGRPAGSVTAKKGGPRTNRTKHLALRVTGETYAAVEKAAHDTHRTSSNWVETAILWALNEGAVKTRQLVPRPKGE